MLSTVADGTEYRTLQLAFGGQGVIAVEWVEIQYVNSDGDFKTVNYVDGGLTSKGFVTTALKTPEYKGALHSVFGGWFEDAAFTTPKTDIADGATYYAKWASVTREVNIANANRLVTCDSTTSANKPYENGDVLTLTPDHANNTLKVDVNKTIDGTIGLGGYTGHNDANQQITLEYYDYEPDGAYSDYPGGYAILEEGKRYAIAVNFAVTAVSGSVQISVGSSEKQLGADSTPGILAFKKDITSVGNYTIYSKTGANNLVDYTYGNSNPNGKLRLAFEGNGTFVIESVIIQEVYDADITAGTTVVVNGVDNGTTYKVAAAKDYNGNWQIPQSFKDKHIDAVFGGWYTDSAYTTPVATPVFNTNYYAKWAYTKTNIDLGNSNLMAGGSSDLVITKPTETTPFIAKFQRYDQNLFADGSFEFIENPWLKSTSVSLEYFDNDPNEQDVVYNGYAVTKAGYKYAINVKYNVTSASYDTAYYPQIAIVTNQSYLSETVATTVYAARKHTTTGEGYILSAVIDGAAANQKFRLAFGGVGTIEIESIEISEVFSNEAGFSTVTFDEEGYRLTDILKDGTALPSLPRTIFQNFGGWYNGEAKVTVVAGDATLTAKWFDKYDVTMNNAIDAVDIVRIKKALANNSTDLVYDIDRDNAVAATDITALRKNLLGDLTIGGVDASAYTAVSGAYESLISNLATEETVNALSLSAESDKKIYVGIAEIDEEILDSKALINLEGVKGDVYGLNDYKIFLYNGDLYIEAGSDYATAFAVNVFVDYLKTNKDFPAGFELSGEYSNEKELLGGYGYITDQGDEFNGETLNINRWYLTEDTIDGTYYSKASQYYLDTKQNESWVDVTGEPVMMDGTIQYLDQEGDNYYLDNGLLVMNTKKTDTGYSATRINAKQHFKYGIMTARVKLATKNGACSSVWSRTIDDNGASVNEMDFVENFGADQVVPNLHTWENYQDTNHDGNIDMQNTIIPAEGESISDTFHDIALYWTEEKIIFYFDGVAYLEQDISDSETWEAFHKTTYMILGIKAPDGYYGSYHNGSTPGEILGSELIDTFSENMYVDYIRVFQK